MRNSRKISINSRVTREETNNSNRARLVKKTVEQLRSCAYDYSASIDDAISSFFLENSLGHDTTIESVAFVLNVLASLIVYLLVLSALFSFFFFLMRI